MKTWLVLFLAFCCLPLMGEELSEDLKLALRVQTWCLENPMGGSVQGREGVLVVTKAERDYKLKVALSEIARMGGVAGDVKPTSNAPVKSQAAQAARASVIESRIDGDFDGWEGETIFKLTNGQIWQQTDFSFKFSYRYSPEVLIYPSSTGWKMRVEGVDGEVRVMQLK